MARAGRKPSQFIGLDYRDYILAELFGGDVRKCKLTADDKENFEKLSWDYFAGQSLAENREIAKRMGVESPFTLPKGELLRHMVAQRWGMQYLATSSVLIRPVDMSLLKAKEELKLIEDNVHGDVIIGEHFEGVFDGNELGGVLRVKKLVRSTGDVGVIKRLVNFHSIKAGDYVTGWGRYVEEHNFFCLFCVESVNGVPVNLPADKKRDEKRVKREREYAEYLRTREKLKTVKSDERLVLADEESVTARLINTFAPVALGYSLVISSENRYDDIAAFKELADVLKRDKTADQVITLCLEEPVEKPSKLTENDVYTTLDDDLDSAAIVERARSYAVSRAKCGEKVIILLNSLERAEDEVAARRLISSAKCYSNGGSVTVITFADRDDRGTYYYAVRRLVTAELKLTAHPFAGELTVNVADCHSPAFELSEDALNVRTVLRSLLKEKGEDYLTALVIGASGYADVAERLLSGERLWK